MKKRIRKIVLLMLSATFLFTLALINTGCGAKKELVFWNPFTGLDGDIVQQLVDEFNATDPEYKVKNVPLAAGDMYTKIPTVISSGENIPDFGIIHYYQIPNYVNNNIIIPMDDVISAYPKMNAENFLPDAWSYGDVDGSRFALPLDMHGAIGYYNVDLMNKYGPHVMDDGIVTLDEIKEMGALAQNDGIYAYGGAAFTGDQFFTFVGEYGGDLVKGGKPNIDCEETRKAIATMEEIYDSGYSTVIGDDNYSLFSSGKVIFTPEGTWTVSGWHNDYPELNFKVAPMLTVGDVPYIYMSSHQFVIYNKSNGKEKAEVTEAKRKVIGDFLEFMRKNSDTWATAGHVPASLEAIESDAFQSLPQSVLVKDEASQESLKLIKFNDWGFVQDACNGVLEDILRGNISLDEGLAKAQKEAEDKIAENHK